ncbi:dethiobiotin synthase [Marilutibacter spongiae]|uniref:ATP-dependent dethiobiotin synthetase BioD n=1 Tax=Marilutibacter spongiae TaxID=2025720 RepID=A0A7W3TPY4_9GAMM|nr:dethiobiotin synthase [Lysobacter spongiae]MBB1062109.1 dethiobiotin synthase [Lysobacter spongiae]
MNPSGIFVTGTDTGIGKSLVSASLLHALRAQGFSAVGMKPVASGCDATPVGLRNEDALLLQAASAPVPAYDEVNPYALAEPLAPELAARDAGVDIRLDVLVEGYRRLAAMADRVVVEGVGGWAAPVSARLDQADLARAMDLPVLMVVGLRLGCINHARLTAAAIAAAGLELVGWVANEVDPAMLRIEDNVAMLRERLPVPCWGRLPFAGDRPSPARLASCLRPGGG